MGRKPLSIEEKQRRLEEKANKFDMRGQAVNVNKLRNLPQYRNKTDEELEIFLAKKEMKAEPSWAFEKRIDEKLEKFEEDYDLKDLKINDREVLRGLVQSIISLEDYEQAIFQLRGRGIDGENLLAIDKLQKVMEGIRKSISDAQNDLAITRKHRKSDHEQSVIAYIDNLKDKARKFLEARQAIIMCEKCDTLLGTIWTLYPNSQNKITLTCLQKDKDGVPCGHKTTVTTKEMLDNKQTNKKEILPDSML